MKRAHLILIVGTLCLASTSSQAGFQFGLGKMGAKKAADVITKSQAQAAAAAGSGGTSPSAYACGAVIPGTFFTASPVDPNSIQALTPIGNVFPTAHTFPADHIYFNWVVATSTSDEPLYSPGDVNLVLANRVEYLIGPRAGTTDYALTFSPCAEITLLLGHVHAITGSLAAQIGAYPNCSQYSTGGETIRNCSKSLSIALTAGQQVGTGVNDFGPLDDTRLTISGFANSSRHNLHIGCPLDYFDATTKSALEAKLGEYRSGTFHPRTIAPVCGTIMQDVVATAQGDWYAPGQPDQPDDPHLALIHDRVYASTAVISVGNSVTASSLSAGAYVIYPKTSADATRINYDFNLVANDGNIYCYNTFYGLPGDGATLPAMAGRIILMQLTSDTTLRIERQGNGVNTTCANASPWSFTGAFTDFQR